MTLRLDEAPGDLAVSIAETKQHLRVDEDDEDSLITSLINAATLHIERATGRRLVVQRWTKSLDQFPESGGAIRLRLVPVISVDEISFIDVNGVRQYLDPAAYELDAQSEAAWVFPAFGYIWPAARERANAVTIKFSSGYGSPNDVPADIKAALLLLIGHLYENREAVIVDARLQALELPMGVNMLLSPYKLMSFV